MGVQVKIEEGRVVAKEPLGKTEELLNNLLGCEDRGLGKGVWIPIVAVEVLVEGVLPVVTSVDAIGVETGHDLKDEVVSE